MALACYNEIPDFFVSRFLLSGFLYLLLNFSKIFIFRHFEKIVKLTFFKFNFFRIAMTECFNSFSVVTMVQWKHNIKILCSGYSIYEKTYVLKILAVRKI